jgi:hypothetical protein
MKPINAENPGCNPISSNCVIWQGPDLDCIGLCKGDSISQVIEKLAKELCTVLESLDINSYDLSCLAIGGCAPEDFQALLQLLITKICALENIDPTTGGTSPTGTTPGTSGTASDVPIQTRVTGGNIPDAVVSTPEEFWYTNAQGDTVKEMQIVDLAYTAANKIETIAGQINTINRTLGNHEGRLATLENALAPTLVIPTITPVCVLPADMTPLDEVTQALEEQFCELRSATGTPLDLYTAFIQQAVGLNQSPTLVNGSITMESIPEWKSDVTSVADILTNMLLTLTDVRAAIKSIQTSCCTTTSCDDLALTVTGVLINPNKLTLYFNGTYPNNFVESQAGGSNVTITDSAGNEIVVTIPIVPNVNTAVGYTIDLLNTPINGASNLTVVVPFSFTDGNDVCEKVVTEIILNDGACPTVQLIPQTEVISWNFTYLAGPASLDIKLFAEDGVTELQSQVNVVTGPETLAGNFTGLLPGVQYKVQLQITPDGAPEATLCPFSGVVTIANACTPPINLNGSVIIP